MATDKQIGYLLLLMKGWTSAELSAVGMTQRERKGDFSLTDIKRASELIDRLKVNSHRNVEAEAMEFRERFEEAKALIAAGKQVGAGSVLGNGHRFVYYEALLLYEGYVEQAVAFDCDRIGVYRGVVDERKASIGHAVRDFRYFIYDKAAKRFLSADELECEA